MTEADGRPSSDKPTCAFCWVQDEPPKSAWLWHRPSECPESAPAGSES